MSTEGRVRYWWCRVCDVKWMSYDRMCWACGRDASIRDAIPGLEVGDVA